MEILERLLNGDVRAIARAITLIENNTLQGQELLASLYPHTGKAVIVGVTGPAGSGKSTLTNQLAKAYRQQGKTVGIIAVDPSSPFTGGAILGDRIRMQEISDDPGIFIRSMGTRGSLGGLARMTGEAIRVLDAAGKDIIIVETVGVGQSEVEIVQVADTVLVVAVPGLGDEIQAIKAGIMEIGDILVVNKADRPGAEKTVFELQAMLDLKPFMPDDWRPPVLKAIATENSGITEVLAAIDTHQEYLQRTGRLEEAQLGRVRHEVNALLQERVLSEIYRRFGEKDFEILVKKVFAKEENPYGAVESILGKVLVPGTNNRA